MVIIKKADDRSSDIETLEGFLGVQGLPKETKVSITSELRNIRAGIAGEKAAAYEIDFHFGESKNIAIIHDLRLSYNGRVAQIDHLIISRFMEVWVCESKSVSEGVSVNSDGEWVRFFKGKPKGMPSPVEQNRRHILVLESLCQDGEISLPKRIGIKLFPDFKNLILVSNSARINKTGFENSSSEAIVKCEKIRSLILSEDDDTLATALKLVSRDILTDFAKQLAALHQPITFDWAAKFGIKDQITEPTVSRKLIEKAPALKDASDQKSKLICDECSAPVPLKVARFCWFNKPRFSGKVYCVSCQEVHPKR